MNELSCISSSSSLCFNIDDKKNVSDENHTILLSYKN